MVVGGGAAGMIAAIAAAEKGCQVQIYEKNEKLGKKLFITGKGRCNVTNACDTEELLAGVVSNPRFLYSSFYGFSNQDMMNCLETWGCPLKIERGNRVFPQSDKSSDVIRTLERRLQDLGVAIHRNTEVESLVTENGRCRGIRLKKGGVLKGEAVIVATGGLSYPSTGSTGDGYRWAREQGHRIIDTSPALVPFNVKELPEIKELQGLALKNVEARVSSGKKELYSGFGEMLFTHFGVSGPLMLSASSFCAKAIRKQPLTLTIDLKPALTVQQLDERILRDFQEVKNKQFKNALDKLLPSGLIPLIVERSGIDPHKQVNQVTRPEREQLIQQIKGLPFTLTSLRDYKEAIITQGGISVKEIDPSTMESRLLPGLYFAGEVLDLDAVTGGYNLQIAWSTGWAAGCSAGDGLLIYINKGI